MLRALQFLIITASLCISDTFVFADTIKVLPGKPLAFHQAIDLAKSGDTILVASGAYSEGNITVDKPLVLFGIGRPVIDGRYKDELFTVTSSDVVIKGFRFLRTATGSMVDYAAIRVQSASRVIIENNVVEDAFFGFHFSNAADCVVKNNRLDGYPKADRQRGNGIHLWKCTRFIIHGNEIAGHRDGIYFEFVTDSKIQRNHSENNQRYGLHFMFSNDDSYIENQFVGNGAGVAVMYSVRVLMKDNQFLRNWGPSSYGLLLKDIRDSEVLDNFFDNNTAGIYMEGSSRIRFIRNEFRNNGWGIRIQASCDGNTFEKSNFISNTFDVATNGSLVLNTFSGNYWDRYQGYDLNRDGIGDTPFHPMNFFSMVVEQMPNMMMLWRSFFVQLLDKAEKVIPVLTPEALRDDQPSLKRYDLVAAD